ncbi:hypothetical protein [Vreelandella sp. GE22]
MIELISSQLEALLYGINADSITGLFCWAILLISVIALYCYKQDKARSFTHYTPNLLTSLGMLGTFIGIVIGLLHFDSADIQGSIPLLLDGLKTAFMTSLFGMALAMVYKVVSGLKFMQPKNNVPSGPKEIGPEHIHQLLSEQNDNLAKLHQAIAGDDSDTLTGQIRLMRQHQDDNHKSLVREVERQSSAAEALGTHAEAQRERFDTFARELSEQMHDFAEMMSKSATEQVIEALKQVIQDFNQKLTEQFGKNFEELNDAVKAMVEWQENYRQQLGEMRDQYAQGVTAISDTEKSVANISTSASAIPETMAGLETLLTATQRQLADLEGHLAAFAEMRDKAVEAVPEINAQVEKTVGDISQAALTAATNLVSGGEELKKELVDGTAKINAEMIEGASGLNERYNSVHQSLQGTSDHLATQAEQIAGQFRDAHESVNAQVRDLVERLSGHSEQMSTRLTEGNERIASQLDDQHRQSAERFETLLSTLEKNATQLNEGAERLSETHRKGVESAEQQVKTLIDQLGQQSTQLTRQLGEADEETQSHLRQSHIQASEQLESLQSQHRKALEEASQQYQNQLNAAYQQVEATMQQAVQRTSDHVNAQMERLDESMQQELQRVMSEMGNALGTISGRFTNDYQKLTAEMQKIVQASQSGGH